MRKEFVPIFVLALMLLLTVSSFSPGVAAQEGTTEDLEEAGNYPEFGFGGQFVYPAGGLSSRTWLSPTYGFEGNAVLWSNPNAGIRGSASLRLLYRLTPDDTVDFYLAGGGAYNLGNRYEPDRLSAVGTGGVSLEVFSENFVLNLEFGLVVQGVERFGPTFGTGFHYYF